MTAQSTPAAHNACPRWQPRHAATSRLRPASGGCASSVGGVSVGHHPFELQHAFTRVAAGNNSVARDIRATIAARSAVLRASLASGVDSLATRRAASQLADEVVVGAFRVAHARIGGQARSMRLPLTLVATGAYGRRVLSPLERPTLLILTEEDADGAALLIDTALEILVRLGFPVDYAEPTAGFPKPHPDTFIPGSRLLWGRRDQPAACRRAS